MGTDNDNVRWLNLDRYNGHGLHKPQLTLHPKMLLFALSLSGLLWAAIIATVVVLT
jgi:hypothetical protein